MYQLYLSILGIYTDTRYQFYMWWYYNNLLNIYCHSKLGLNRFNFVLKSNGFYIDKSVFFKIKMTINCLIVNKSSYITINFFSSSRDSFCMLYSFSYNLTFIVYFCGQFRHNCSIVIISPIYQSYSTLLIVQIPRFLISIHENDSYRWEITSKHNAAATCTTLNCLFYFQH